jgi:hypothetical protein
MQVMTLCAETSVPHDFVQLKRPNTPLGQSGWPPRGATGLAVDSQHKKLRLLVGLWWGAHFAGVAALGILVHDAMNEILKNAPQQAAARIALSLHLAFLFAATLYLFLSVAAFFRDPTAHARLCSWRFIIDLALSLVAWGWPRTPAFGHQPIPSLLLGL